MQRFNLSVALINPLFDWLAGMTGTDRPRRHVFGHDRPRTNHTSVFHRNPRMNERFGCNPDMIAYDNGLSQERKAAFCVIVRSRA